MKMTNDEIRTLKKLHLLQSVMQEAGEKFIVDPSNTELWHSIITQGLTVNVRRQQFEVKEARP